MYLVVNPQNTKLLGILSAVFYRFVVVFSLFLIPSVAVAGEDQCKDVINLSYREYVSSSKTYYDFQETFRKACETYGQNSEVGASAVYDGVPLGFKQKQEYYRHACNEYLNKRTSYSSEALATDALSPLLGKAIDAWRECMRESVTTGPRTRLDKYERQPTGSTKFDLVINADATDPPLRWRQDVAFVPSGSALCEKEPPLPKKGKKVESNTFHCEHLPTRPGAPLEKADLVAVIEGLNQLQPITRLPAQVPRCAIGCQSCAFRQNEAVCLSQTRHYRDIFSGLGPYASVAKGGTMSLSCERMKPSRKVALAIDLGFTPQGFAGQVADGGGTWHGIFMLYATGGGGTKEYLMSLGPVPGNKNGSAGGKFVFQREFASPTGKLTVYFLNNDITMYDSQSRPTSPLALLDATISCRSEE